ncbi:MAG: hypothetical protein AMJ43_07260 [Coxiella sp. DG_40]|nr:MAG: hypothetical protein AMJ43_07260 [Coxiella sp. DG_40]
MSQIRANMFGDSSKDKQDKQLINHILRPYLTVDLYAQKLSAEFINDIQYPKRSAVTGSFYHEIIAPDVVLMLRP